MGVIEETIHSLKILHVTCKFRFYTSDFPRTKFIYIISALLYLGEIIFFGYI